MSLSRANTYFRRPNSQQVNVETRGSAWNRRLDAFKLSQQNQAPLGPQEEEIEKMYGQIHGLVEAFNSKFGVSMKKKEENCMIAFKKVMLSVEKDLKEIKQQVDESQKITRDTSEDDAFTNLQKQLAFFRDESIKLSKKLKVAEDKIKELKKKNKDLEDDRAQDYKILLQSQRERKALKTLLLTAGTLSAGAIKQEISANSSAFSSRQGIELYDSKHNSDIAFESRRSSTAAAGPITDRKTPMNKTSRTSSTSKSVESKYKKENLHLNSLKEQLNQALKKKAGFLNSDKADEMIQIVTAVVMNHIQTQEQQLTTLNGKIMRIKKFYQSLLKTQVGAEVPSTLYDLLFMFSEVFSSYRGREGLENIGRLSARMIENEQTSLFKTEVLSYRNSVEPEGNQSSIFESIRNINEKYGQIGTEDKVQIMQKLLNEPGVNALLTSYLESYKEKKKEETSPGHKLVSTRETGSNVQSPARRRLIENEPEERNGQLGMFKDNYFFSKTKFKKVSDKPPLIDTKLIKNRSVSSLSARGQSTNFYEDRRCKGSESHKESYNRENRSRTDKDSHSFGQLEGSHGMDVSFSTPVDVARQRTFGDQEIQMPTGEEKPGNDFRKRFLVKAGKAVLNE